MMTSTQNTEQRNDPQTTDPAQAIKGTEAEKKGGIKPAQEQAERDWQDSSKESGE